MPVRVTVVSNGAELARRAADVVFDAARAQPAATLGLPSGRTPLGLYDELARRVADGRTDFGSVTAFAIDELHGVPPDHPATNASYFRDRLTSRVPLRALHVMDSAAQDADAECARFARLIEDAGGLGIAVLGIGANGHVAFNEPGSRFDSRARRVALERSSRRQLAHAFGSLEATPAFGLTLGIADLLAAQAILLLAAGEEKAEVVAAALEGPETEALPASALRRHPALTVVLDRAAASLLRR